MIQNVDLCEDSQSLFPTLTLLAQFVRLQNFNFKNQSFLGRTELTFSFKSEKPNLIRLNSRQIKIFSVYMDGFRCGYDYFNPLGGICNAGDSRYDITHLSNLRSFAEFSTDSSMGNGELIIYSPDVWLLKKSEGNCFVVSIDFILESPKCGVFFYAPTGGESKQSRYYHVYTYGHDTRYWLPCLDSSHTPCIWTFEITVENSLTAVASGDLCEVKSVVEGSLVLKTFSFSSVIPVTAPSIGFAVGCFEFLLDNHIPEVYNYCLSPFTLSLPNTVSVTHKVFEYFEELTSCRYPFNAYKQVFVCGFGQQVETYASLSLLSVNLLFDKSIIDQGWTTQIAIASSVASQYFGCFVTSETCHDWWLCCGLSSYLCHSFIRTKYGNNEYRYFVYQALNDVIEHERKQGIKLSSCDRYYCDCGGKSTYRTAEYISLARKKAFLVVRIIESKISFSALIQVINKLLVLALNASPQQPSSWCNLRISVDGFLRLLGTVSSVDINPILELWVYKTQVSHFRIKYVYNRRKNCVELELKQEQNSDVFNRYRGPLTVTLQELDGYFTHVIQIDDNCIKVEVACYSRAKRNKKRKIPLQNGEELDLDILGPEPENPVLWLRVDPEINILRTIEISQTESQWLYQMCYSRDIVSQFDALEAAVHFPSLQACTSIVSLIACHQYYYRLRMKGVAVLVEICNSQILSLDGESELISLYRKFFMVADNQDVVRFNDFTKFQLYFLRKCIPEGLARLTNPSGKCSVNIINFLLYLLKMNNNSRNQYSDCYLRSALLDALCGALTNSVRNADVACKNNDVIAHAALDIGTVIREFIDTLNYERLLNSYHCTVSSSCLYAIYALQKSRYLKTNEDIFLHYAAKGQYEGIRFTAVDIITKLISDLNSFDLLDALLKMVEGHEFTSIKLHIVHCLTKNRPFSSDSTHPLNNISVIKRVWSAVLASLHNRELSIELMNYWRCLFGINRPSCLPALKRISASVDGAYVEPVGFSLTFKCESDEKSLQTEHASTIVLSSDSNNSSDSDCVIVTPH